MPCSQYDKDYGNRCSEPRPGAPYGYKSVQKPYTKCCRDKIIRVNKFSGRWKASANEKEWTVELSLDDLEKAISWIVTDNSGEVRERN